MGRKGVSPPTWWILSNLLELKELTEKLIDTIRLDVTNIRIKASSAVLQPEHQEALVRYYKAVTDARISAKEAHLDELITRAEEAANTSGASGTPKG